MDASERALLHRTVTDAIGATDGSTAAVDRTLDELGWRDLLHTEPEDAVATVFSTLGTTNATASALDDVLAAALGIDPEPELAVLFSPFASWAAPSDEGITTARVSTASELLVVGARVSSASIEHHPVIGIDPTAELHRVRVRSHAEGTSVDEGAWGIAVAAGQVAIAHQMAGACRAMLELARAHALERVQFDRPIARFQAVRHRLADALVATEALEAGLTAAADAPGPMTAALTKSLAGRAARTVASHCQQVLAGIGFTTDHPFHRYFKRTLLLDGLFGSTDQLTVDLGRQLLATRTVPTLVEL